MSFYSFTHLLRCTVWHVLNFACAFTVVFYCIALHSFCLSFLIWSTKQYTVGSGRSPYSHWSTGTVLWARSTQALGQQLQRRLGVWGENNSILEKPVNIGRFSDLCFFTGWLKACQTLSIGCRDAFQSPLKLLESIPWISTSFEVPFQCPYHARVNDSTSI